LKNIPWLPALIVSLFSLSLYDNKLWFIVVFLVACWFFTRDFYKKIMGDYHGYLSTMGNSPAETNDETNSTFSDDSKSQTIERNTEGKSILTGAVNLIIVIFVVCLVIFSAQYFWQYYGREYFENDELSAQKAVLNSLKDPDSAKFRKFTIVNGTAGQDSLVKACLEVNAKNSMGGYNGFQIANLIKLKGSSQWIVASIGGRRPFCSGL